MCGSYIQPPLKLRLRRSRRRRRRRRRLRRRRRSRLHVLFECDRPLTVMASSIAFRGKVAAGVRVKG